MQLLTAPQIVAGGCLLRPGWVLFDTAIHEVGEGNPPARVLQAATTVTTLPEGVLAPGLVDIQVNGAFGIDFAAGSDDDWVTVATRLPSTGVTAFVPTLITAPVEDLTRSLRTYESLRARLDSVAGAARTLGVHLEGPFLSAKRRGAHRQELLCDPDPRQVAALLDSAGGGALAYVTLAPERRGALEATEKLTSAGVRVSIGHTDADAATFRAAADAGATLVTHLYNAQRPMHHRDPGTVGAALTDLRLTCGLIVDLHHVAAMAVQVAFQAASGRVALVTDAVAAMGMPDGTYELGGEQLEVHPGQPPRRSDGTIAGSALRMDEAIRNCVLHCSMDLPTAVDAATRIPATALGRDDLGKIEPGAPADLVWLGTEYLAMRTWVGGQVVWEQEGSRVSLAGSS